MALELRQGLWHGLHRRHFGAARAQQGRKEVARIGFVFDHQHPKSLKGWRRRLGRDLIAPGRERWNREGERER